MNGWVDALVEEIIKEPVRESVHEAFDEMGHKYDAPDTDENDAAVGGGPRLRWMVPVVVALVAITYAVRKMWSSSRDRLPPASEFASADAGADRSYQSDADTQVETSGTGETENDELEAEVPTGEDQ